MTQSDTISCKLQFGQDWSFKIRFEQQLICLHCEMDICLHDCCGNSGGCGIGTLENQKICVEGKLTGLRSSTIIATVDGCKANTNSD